MAMMKIPLVFLIVVSMLLLLYKGRLADSVYTNSIGEIDTRVVNITNDLDSGIDLTIHCKSEDNDLGQHDLPFQSSFSWSFKSNVVITNTDFYCYMGWQSVSGSFDVYKASRDDERCAEKCWWSIQQFGAFSYDQANDRWDLVYIWQK